MKSIEHGNKIISCSDSFCSMFQIKRKKVEEYLLTIRVFVYLCVKFKFCYLRSNTHILLLIINILYIYHLSTQQFLT